MGPPASAPSNDASVGLWVICVCLVATTMLVWGVCYVKWVMFQREMKDKYGNIGVWPAAEVAVMSPRAGSATEVNPLQTALLNKDIVIHQTCPLWSAVRSSSSMPSMEMPQRDDQSNISI
eukprot:TRINITY_DN6780_c1_g3_i1.p3 TRINITY_DN6780_c1_g3~~TRINITY_DN6780_c1_g3_i1.p3  ORF type:complete len:120 (+),score=18.13 TRINITY_DN6780_c1_g3_i1:54-413(+)